MKTTDINTAKIFGLRFSGHGSDFLPKNPLFDKTFEEAKKQALEWELRADTIEWGRRNCNSIRFYYKSRKNYRLWNNKVIQ